jgi:hypothetical protein
MAGAQVFRVGNARRKLLCAIRQPNGLCEKLGIIEESCDFEFADALNCGPQTNRLLFR